VASHPIIPKGYIVEKQRPIIPEGFVLEQPKLKTTLISDLFPEPVKIDESQPFLRASPELTVGDKFRSFVRNIFEDKESTNVKSQMIYQISKDTGKSLQDVAKNYDSLIRDPKITGIQPDPTLKESVEFGFTGAIAVGLATNPVATVLGVSTFMAVDEVENAIISSIKDGKYNFGAGRNVSELLPEDATRVSKETVEILDLIGKGMIVGRVTPKARTAFKKASEFVTKKFIEEYHLPKELYMDAAKVKSILRGAEKDKFSAEEKDLLLDLGLSGSQYRQALNDGVTIRVPAEKVTKLVDRAWWGKVKETFGKPIAEDVIIRKRSGSVSEAPRGLLTEGTPITEPIAQAKPIQPAIVKPQVEPPTPPAVEKPVVSTGNYQHLEAPKYVTDFLMERKSGMTINDAGSIGYTESKSSSAMISKLFKQGFIERNDSNGYRLTKKGKEAKSQVAENERLEKEGVSMDHYSQKKVKKDPLMNGINVLVGKMDGEPAYSNGHYLIKGKPAPETVISDQSPPFDSVIPQSSVSDPIAKPIGWYQSSNGKMVVLSDGTKHSAVDGKYYDFIKSKFPDSDFRLTTEGKVIKLATAKDAVDRRFNKVSIYSGGKRVGILMPVRVIITPDMLSKLTKATPDKPVTTLTAVEKPKLTESETNELSALKENLTSTFSRMSDQNRTNTQLLQDQNAALRIIKLIEGKDPSFIAPEFPFESDLDQVEASTFIRANTEASNQHFRETEPFKEKIKDVERISRNEITQFMRKRFGVTIRGFATHKKANFAGFFSPDKKTVRSKVTDDIYVLSHEVAHFLDNKVWGTQPKQRPHFKEWQVELGKLDYDSKKRRTSEGFAEFIRHFVSTGKSKELAPTFYEYFTGEFARENKDIYDGIIELRDLMSRYHKQGSIERVKSQINFKGKQPKESLGDTSKELKLRFKEAWLDDIAFLEDIFKQHKIKDIEPSRDPLQLLRAFKNKARSKAEMMIRHNTTDYVGRITGKGLVEVIKPISQTAAELENFLTYAYARRALSRPDIDAGIELSDAEFVFNKYDSKKFRSASDELSAFADRVLEYYVDSRGMSPEVRDIIKEQNPIYLPLFRFFNESSRFKSGTKSRISGKKPVKTLKGSGRQIINPIEGMIRYVENIISAADKTRIAVAFKDLADQDILPGSLIEEVPAPTEIKSMKLGTLLKQLKKHGVHKNLTQEQNDELVTLFTVGKHYFGKDNIIPIWEEKNVKFYELDPRLYKMLEGLDIYHLQGVLRFMAAPTRLIKFGAVGLNATFSFILNPIRDLITYTIFTKDKLPNPAAPLVGLLADLGVGSKASLEAARRFKAQGGDMATIMGRDRARYPRMMSEIIASARGGVPGVIGNVVFHPIDALRRVFETPELASRIAEMKHRISYYENIYGKDSDAAYIKAFNDAQDVTINFSKMGHSAQILNQMIPFFNPSIQGEYKIYNEAKTNPIKTIVRGVSFITTASLYFWHLNKDKDWYKNLPAEIKYSHIYIDMSDYGDGEDIISLPLPHELGTLFGGLPMAYFDEQYEIDQEGVDKAVSLLISQFNPGVSPLELSVIKPFMLVAGNKTWYGAPLETLKMQRMEIPDRYRDYTMPIAKELSRFIYDNIGHYKHLSPVKIEAFANATTGGLTKTINDIARYVEEGAETKADIPVIGSAFLRKEIYEHRPDFDFNRLKLLRQKKVSKTLTNNERKELRLTELKYKNYIRALKRRDIRNKRKELSTP
jgi:hypothetical protein